jgi:nucleotide-binding universal stress UspA family protein
MNSNIKRILVPTDTSEFSNLALQYALLFQKKLGSQITLLYAEEFSFLFTGEYPIGYYFENVPEVKKHAAESLRKYAGEHVPNSAAVTTMIIDDTPARAILIAADDIQADLILMGTHGRHGLRRALLGSVTERVLRDTERPVMTVAPQLFPTNGEVKFATILCPVNFTSVAHQALEEACGFAEAFGADLIVMHVSEPDDTHGKSIEARFSGWVDPLVRDRTRYQQILVSGDPATQILEVAEQIGIDLIVVGAQHKRFSDATVIGTTTERITRFAKQPVLTVVRRTAAEKRQERKEELAVTV